MEALSEKLNPIIERISSPISAAFIVSWVAINWRLVLYFFDSGLHTADKIIIIQSNATMADVLIWPALFALLYLIAMPMILFIYRYYTDFISTINAKEESLTKRKIEAYEKFSSLNYVEIPSALLAYFNHMQIQTMQYQEQLRAALADPSILQRRESFRSLIDGFNSNCIDTMKLIEGDLNRLRKLINNSKLTDHAQDTRKLRNMIVLAKHHARQLVYGINHDRF